MLSIPQRKQLRALAHSLKPVVLVGKKGFSQALLDETNAALLAHELIKIKFQEAALEETDKIVQDLCQELTVDLVEKRGHVVTLYKPHPQKPKIKLA